MKRALLLVIALPIVAMVCGCTEMSPEDREFYGKGWIHPGELDQERPTKMPAHPETTGSLGSSAPANPAMSGDSGRWATPDTY